jgi:hypothetical protein
MDERMITDYYSFKKDDRVVVYYPLGEGHLHNLEWGTIVELDKQFFPGSGAIVYAVVEFPGGEKERYSPKNLAHILKGWELSKEDRDGYQVYVAKHDDGMSVEDTVLRRLLESLSNKRICSGCFCSPTKKQRKRSIDLYGIIVCRKCEDRQLRFGNLVPISKEG